MSNNKQSSVDKEFVPYEESLTLKELGFDEKCLCNWEESWSPEPEHEIRMVLTTDQTWLRPGWICAPTFSQAFRWFDEHTDLMGFVVPSIKDNHFDWLIRVDWEEEIECEEAYSSRIEAELACLRKLIEIVQGDNNEQ